MKYTNKMEQVDAAEKEASEVLHSLLSVERIEKQSLVSEQSNQQIVVVASADANSSLNTVQPSDANCVNSDNQDLSAVQWHTPVTVHQAWFTNMVGVNQALSGDQVIWQFNQESLSCNQQQNSIHVLPELETNETSFNVSAQTKGNSERKGVKWKSNKIALGKGTPLKRKPKITVDLPQESSKLEKSAQEVRERFEKGCECQEENCFLGLNPEYVYRHRLNIAELTKGEHDMYLMGVTMAVLTNPEETVRHKERRRLRAQYVFQGRRVCLDAFLYLENCTHYQLKRIRKHVMTHGVAPRVHGNHGKKPHNTFPLDSYTHAVAFLREFIERHTSSSNSQIVNTSCKGKTKPGNKNVPIYLPAEITRKTIHTAYRKYCEQFDPSIKVMGYSTFRQYMKEQFPHVKFCKLEGSVNKIANSSQQQRQIQQQPPSLPSQQLQQQQPPFLQQQDLQNEQDVSEKYLSGNTPGMTVEIVSAQDLKIHESIITSKDEENHIENQGAIINSTVDMQQVTAIPVLLSQQNDPLSPAMTHTTQNSEQTHHQQPTTFIVAPVSQLLQSPIGSGTSVNSNDSNTFTSYQLTTTSDYTQQQLNPAQVGTITVASVQNNPYAFTSL